MRPVWIWNVLGSTFKITAVEMDDGGDADDADDNV